MGIRRQALGVVAGLALSSITTTDAFACRAWVAGIAPGAHPAAPAPGSALQRAAGAGRGGRIDSRSQSSVSRARGGSLSLSAVASESLGVELRKDFPLLKEIVNDKPLIYLDSAATSQKPIQVCVRVCVCVCVCFLSHPAARCHAHSHMNSTNEHIYETHSPSRCSSCSMPCTHTPIQHTNT